jgi:hypothetical protein
LPASTSLGDQKLIYYLGATDGWIIPRFNDETPIDYTQNYAYQTVATNLRGFDQNIRNGNSFALINSEIRVPIFKYLLNRRLSQTLSATSRSSASAMWVRRGRALHLMIPRVHSTGKLFLPEIF